jgi:hypothetical protein
MKADTIAIAWTYPELLCLEDVLLEALGGETAACTVNPDVAACLQRVKEALGTAASLRESVHRHETDAPPAVVSTETAPRYTAQRQTAPQRRQRQARAKQASLPPLQRTPEALYGWDKPQEAP